MWTDAYVGRPYQELGRGPEAYDCLGLFLTLQRERMGRDLPDPGVTMIGAVREKTAVSYREHFRSVDRAREGDALLFRHLGRDLHVAFALDDQFMIHASDATCGSTVERWRSSLWFPRLVGAYRYAG